MSQDYVERAERQQTLWQRVEGLPRLPLIAGLVIGAVVFLVLHVVQDMHQNVALVLAFVAESVVSFVLLVACAVYSAVKGSRRAVTTLGGEHDAIGG